MALGQSGVELGRAGQVLDHALEKHAGHQSLCVVLLCEVI